MHPSASATISTSTENTTSPSNTTETTTASSTSGDTSSSTASISSTEASAGSPSSTSPSSSNAPASTEDGSTYTSRSTLFSSPINYSLKEGEFLHDSRSGDKTLMEYVNHVGAMNVFDIFLDYTRVITQDAKQSASVFNKEENRSFNRYNDIRCIDSTRVVVP